MSVFFSLPFPNHTPSELRRQNAGIRAIGIRCQKRLPLARDAFPEERRTGKGLYISGICCIRYGQCSPFSGSLKNSVPERAFSGTEYARGAKNRLLWYATHFQGHSVRRTGFCGTEGIFGTGNALLRYGVHLHSEARCTGNALLLYRMGFRGASMGSLFVLGECLR